MENIIDLNKFAGGAWRIEVMKEIKDYLEEKLKEFPDVKVIS